MLVHTSCNIMPQIGRELLPVHLGILGDVRASLEVLLARAEGPHGLERTVVLKRIVADQLGESDAAREFTREASAYARLDHPAIVRYVAHGRTAAATPSFSRRSIGRTNLATVEPITSSTPSSPV